jgi:hypothetical protein
MDGVDVGGPTRCKGPAFAEDTTQCTVSGTDFQPRSSMPVMGPWPKCKAGDNMLHPIGSGTPSAAARVQAFDAMALRLWRNEKPISAADVLQARNDYSVMEGLGSRVGRRQDIHYAELPGSAKLSCGEAGFPEKYPDRCAGPAKLKPIIDEAFQ